MPNTRKLICWITLLPLVHLQLAAAIIGTNVPSRPLSSSRMATLPHRERLAWENYLSTSMKQSRDDQRLFRDEVLTAGCTNFISPPPARGTSGISLNQPATWYSTGEARRIAAIIISFQTPAGGWSKNLDMTHHRRIPGEMFAHANASRFATTADLDTPENPDWNYVGTFDNGATITQLRFLAKIVSVSKEMEGEVYRKAFLRGLDYIVASQFPNGGWPQVWPLQGGYHDCVTFNDGAMTGILDLLLDVSEAREEFSFVPKSIRQKAAVSLQRGLNCILATQIVSNNHLTAWCQQYDALTLQPASARNYEMPSICSGESAGVLLFLMRFPKPESNIVAATQSAVAWFHSTAVRDQSFRRTDANDGRHLVDSPGSTPLWARYYEIGSNRPIFGDRDKSIHDAVEEISRERRDGYAWFTDGPQDALKKYDAWIKKTAAQK